MNSEARVEMLSAYLDDELKPEERTQVEDLLEKDPEARRQLEGMRSTVTGLQHLERLAPPPTLGQDVARRIVLAGEKRSLLDRIEDSLTGFGQQSNTFLMFAVVFALAAIMYFFAHALNQERNGLPVTFDDPGSQSAPVDGSASSSVRKASTALAAGRVFQRTEDDVWVEDGLSDEQIANARVLDLGADPELREQYPKLAGISMLGSVVFVTLDGEVVEVRTPQATP